MNPDLRRLLLSLGGATAGYVLLMLTNPARPSFRDGLRCLARYKQIWWLPVVFGLAHSAFGLWMRWYEGRLIPGAPPLILPWEGWQPPPLPGVWAACALPTAEGTAAIFNCVVTAFPLSALWAFLFLVNWRGYQGVLLRGLRRRLGGAAGGVIHAGVVACAVAAVFKPVIFGGLTFLNAYVGEATLLGAGEILNCLSFLFEYLLGVGVQIYLVLICFAWIRGLNFDADSLRRFAVRRFVFVVKWALVILGISTLGINLPLIVAAFPWQGQYPAPGWVEPAVLGARWFLAGVLIVFCSMQILLIFHNESLRQALDDHFRLWRHHGLHVGWMILVSALHFFLLAAANAYLSGALGPWTWPAAAWSLVAYPLLWATLASWLLASWVCLFRRCEMNRADQEELVRF